MKNKLYIFHRSDMFYPLILRDDKEAIENAHINPGTTKVVDESGRIIFKMEVAYKA